MMRRSSFVSVPCLRRMESGIPSFPISWRSAPHRTLTNASPDIPIDAANSAAISATRFACASGSAARRSSKRTHPSNISSQSSRNSVRFTSGPVSPRRRFPIPQNRKQRHPATNDRTAPRPMAANGRNASVWLSRTSVRSAAISTTVKMFARGPVDTRLSRARCETLIVVPL